MTIDPIDGTGSYIKHIKAALEQGNIDSYLKVDLGPGADHCLLLGIVENSVPKFASAYNYVTEEFIFVDGENKRHYFTTTNNRRTVYLQKNAFYACARVDESIMSRVKNMQDVDVIRQDPFGLSALLVAINPHENAAVCHRAQSASLWDVLPVCVVASISSAKVLDDKGNEVKFDEYITLPGRGGSVYRGSLFSWIEKYLKENPGFEKNAVDY